MGGCRFCEYDQGAFDRSYESLPLAAFVPWLQQVSSIRDLFTHSPIHGSRPWVTLQSLQVLERKSFWHAEHLADVTAASKAAVAMAYPGSAQMSAKVTHP